MNQSQAPTARWETASPWPPAPIPVPGPGVLLPESALSPQVVDVAPELLRICSLIQADSRVPAGEGGSHAEGGSGEMRSGRAPGPGADRDCGPGSPGSLPLHSPPRHQGCTAAAPDVLGQTARRQLPFRTGLAAWRQGTGAPGQPRPHLDCGLQRGQRNQPAQAPRPPPKPRPTSCLTKDSGPHTHLESQPCLLPSRAVPGPGAAVLWDNTNGLVTTYCNKGSSFYA